MRWATMLWIGGLMSLTPFCQADTPPVAPAAKAAGMSEVLNQRGGFGPSQGAADQVRTGKRFADFGFLPAAGKYEGRVFRLSQNYPPQAPGANHLPKFMKIDFQRQWKEYLLAAREYCFEGNIHGGDVEDDFFIPDNPQPRWFHMPWQHFGPYGREGIHGLTKEAPVQPRQLAAAQTSSGQTYAVGFFNEFGGSTIGQVWADRSQPNLHNIRFPHGTVIFKLLFVDIPPQEVPSLCNPVRWQGYITENFASTRRRVAELTLIQMDLMVRDDQSPLGWIFGTYQYNGAVAKKNPWENLVPLGIQWGNDPDVREHHVNDRPDKTVRNPKLKETIINDDDTELPPTHLGWNGRLNGPVDNPMSSCMSCHATAQVRQKSPLSPTFQRAPPEPGSDAWMRWFQNYRCGDRFDQDIPSADFSIQLAISVQNYQRWRSEEIGISAKNYTHKAQKAKAASEAESRFTEQINAQGKPQESSRIQRSFAE